MHQPQLTQANSQMTLFIVTSMPIEVSFVLKIASVTAELRHKETEYYIYTHTHTEAQILGLIHNINFNYSFNWFVYYSTAASVDQWIYQY